MSIVQETPRFDAPRPVLQTVEQTPLSLELPQYPALRFYPNGLIDLEPDKDKYPDDSYRLGVEYQETAMKHIDTILPDGVMALGSHLLDAAILRTRVAPIGRPDVMVFNQGELDIMYEFKRTWHTDYGEKRLRDKLERISLFLKTLRDDPTLLGRFIQRVTGQDILPNPIRIARDSKLKPLVFVSSSAWNREELLTSRRTGLKGTFLMVPVSNVES